MEILWPRHDCCVAKGFDFSAELETEEHTFVGPTHEYTGSFGIRQSPQVDFIPVEIFRVFPRLNGLYFDRINLPVVKYGLFRKEFDRIEYLKLSALGAIHI